MRILVVSDTHRNNEPFLRVLDEVGEPDMVVHCGDIMGSEYFFERVCTCPLVMVTGNNDFPGGIKASEEFDLCGHHFWVNHGHRYGVYYDRKDLMKAAKDRGADVVFYGHTHVPLVEYDDELRVYAVNPGSIGYPRQVNHKPSYLIVEIDQNNELHFSINFL